MTKKIIDFLVFFIYIIVQNTEYFTRYKTTLIILQPTRRLQLCFSALN